MTWRVLPVLCVHLLAALAIGCGRSATETSAGPQSFPLVRTEPASSQTAELITRLDQPIAITFAIGSVSDGFNSLQIAQDGSVFYQFHVSCIPDQVAFSGVPMQEWRRAEFNVDAATMQLLRKLLIEQNLDAWAAEYHADVDDGTQAVVIVSFSQELKKRTYFNNHFTDAFRSIHQFLNEQVIVPNAAALRRAERVSDDEMIMNPQ